MNTGEYKRPRIIIGIIIVFVFVFIFFISSPPWDTHDYVVAYHSILALLAITASAATVVRTRIDPSPYHYVLYAMMVYLSTLHVGSAVLHFFIQDEIVAHTFTYGIFFDIFEVLIISVFFLLSVILKEKDYQEDTVWTRSFTIPVILVTVFLLTGFMFMVSELGLDPSFYLISGYTMGIAAVICFILSIIYFLRRPDSNSSHDSVRLAVANCFLLISTLILLLLLPSPTILWLHTVGFQAGAYVYIILATAYPYLIDVKIRSRIAYGLVIAMVCLAVFPFIIGQVMKGYLSSAFYEDLGATVFIHLAASLFLIAMGLILYFRNNRRLSGYQSPIIFLLNAWAITEIAIVLSHFNPLNVSNIETTSPFVIGSALSVICLLVAIRRILAPSEVVNKYAPVNHSVGLAVVSVFLIVGEILQWSLYESVPGLIATTFGESIILLLTYTAVFELIFFILLLATKSGGKFTFEFVAVGSQSIWLVSLILKADFLDWTAGWWAADGLVGITVLFFPLVIIMMDRLDPFQVQSVKTRSSMISDLVSKDVMEYHSVAIDELTTLGQTANTDESTLEVISRVLADLSYADDLVRYQSTLLCEEKFQDEDLEPIDVVGSINIGFIRVKEKYSQLDLEILVEESTGTYFVVANSLLSDLFYYFFSAIATRMYNTLSFSVALTPDMKVPDQMLMISVKVKSTSVSVGDKRELLLRYLTDDRSGGPEVIFVKALVHAYGGTLELLEEDVEPDELVFEIGLPMVDQSKNYYQV